MSASSLERAVGKGHSRPLWISVTQSLPGRWQEGVDISPLPAKGRDGISPIPRAGSESRMEKGTQFSTRRALKASWGCCDNTGLQTKVLPASRSSSWGQGLAHQRHIQLDSPCHTAKDTSDCLGLRALWKPFGTGRYKNKEDFCFKNFVFRASRDMLGPD